VVVLGWLYTGVRYQQLQALCADWRRVLWSTAPADRPAAERAVQQAWLAIGLAPPKGIIWCDSPLTGAQAAAEILATEQPTTVPLSSQFADRLEWALKVALHENEGVPADQIEGEYEKLFSYLPPLGAGWLRASVEREVAGEIETRLGIHRAAELRERMFHSWSFAELLIACDHFRWTGATESCGRLEGLLTLARSAGWCWPFEQTVVLTERPSRLLCDDRNNLHADDGPAVAWPDGFALWHWHGTRVPRAVIEHPETITLQAIQTTIDRPLRHALLDRYGPTRYLHDANPTLIHHDHTGHLWRADLPNDEPVVMVEVHNATPTPDGTHEPFWLRVPPAMQTAHEAVAWTFGLPPADYHPAIQT